LSLMHGANMKIVVPVINRLGSMATRSVRTICCNVKSAFSFAIYQMCATILRRSRRMKSAGHVARMGKRCVYRVLVGKPKGKRPLGRPGLRCEHNKKMDLQELGWRGHGLDRCGSE